MYRPALKRPGINGSVVVMASLLLIARANPVVRGAQGDSSVSGKVVDECRGVIPGARITLTKDGGETTVHSNASGQFEFLKVPSGTYQLRGSLPGFVVATRDIHVSEGKPTHVELIFEVDIRSIQLQHPDANVIGSPGGAFRAADALVHLRVRSTPRVFMLRGWPAAEHEVDLVDVFKSPGDGRPQRTWHDPTPPPPLETIIGGRMITILQSNAMMWFQGPDVQYKPAGEFVAFLYWGCSERWELSHTLPVRDGRVVVPTSMSGMNAENTDWVRLDGLSVARCAKELERLARELPDLPARMYL